MYAFYQKHEKLLIAVFVLLIQLSVVPFLNGRYLDTDNYTHAVRLLDLFQSKTWAETPYMHSNFPFGEVLHFTRITDVLWLLCAAPLMPFMPLKSAVFWGGMVFQTVVSVGVALALVRALKPVVPAFFGLLGVVFFFLLPTSAETFIIAKPDHHALTALFAVLTIGGMIRALAGEANAARQAGLFAALGLWTSIEGVAIAYAVLFPVVLLWIFNRESLRPAVDFTMSFFACSLLFLAINPPYEGFFAPDNGRLSFLFAVVIGLSAVSFALCARIQSTDWKVRFGAVVGAGSLSAAFVLASFGADTVLEPWFPPFIRLIWANSIVELQSGVSSPIYFMLTLLPSVLSLLCAAAAFKHATSFERKVLLLTGVPLLIFAGLTAQALRYSRPAAVFSVFPVALAGYVWLEKTGKLMQVKQGVRTAVLYGAGILFLAVNYISVSRVLNSCLTASPVLLTPALSAKGALLIESNFAPEAVWMTGRPVVGTPYHRNVEGIADAFYMFHDQNEANVLYLLKKHRISDIALYVAKAGHPDIIDFDWRKRRLFGLYSWFKNEFAARLVRGTDLPCGITPVHPIPLPWLVYHVDFSGCGLAGSSS